MQFVLYSYKADLLAVCSICKNDLLACQQVSWALCIWEPDRITDMLSFPYAIYKLYISYTTCDSNLHVSGETVSFFSYENAYCGQLIKCTTFLASRVVTFLKITDLCVHYFNFCLQNL